MSRIIKFRAWDKEQEQMMPWEDVTCFDFQQLIDDPNIVMEQFTGLHDKNGKEIYEGDIVLTDECGWIGNVIYNRDVFIVVDDRCGFSSYCNWEEFEVIGNIHENNIKEKAND